MAFDGVFTPAGTVLEVPNLFGQATINQGRAALVPDETEASLVSEDGRKFPVDEAAEPAKRGRKPKPAAAAAESEPGESAEPEQPAADPFD